MGRPYKLATYNATGGRLLVLPRDAEVLRLALDRLVDNTYTFNPKTSYIDNVFNCSIYTHRYNIYDIHKYLYIK